MALMDEQHKVKVPLETTQLGRSFLKVKKDVERLHLALMDSKAEMERSMVSGLTIYDCMELHQDAIKVLSSIGALIEQMVEETA